MTDKQFEEIRDRARDLLLLARGWEDEQVPDMKAQRWETVHDRAWALYCSLDMWERL